MLAADLEPAAAATPGAGAQVGPEGASIHDGVKPEHDVSMEEQGGDASSSQGDPDHPVKPESSDNEDGKRTSSEIEAADSESKRQKLSTDNPADVDIEDDPSGDASEAASEVANADENVSASEMTSLEKAQQAAERARIPMLPELDGPVPVEPGSGLPKHQHKYSLSAIRAIKRLKDAMPFVAPVDPIKQGVPQYFEYIKYPMDLGTMEKKLLGNEYDSIKQLVDDFNYIVSNCIVFNGEEALISKMALNIAQSFKKQLSNMPTFDASKKGSQAQAQAQAEAAVVEESAVHEEVVGKRSSTATTVLGPNGVPTLRRKSTIDGRPKREIRPPRAHSGYVGSGTGEGRPRNKKYAAELRFCAQLLRELHSRKLEQIAWPFLLPVDPVEQGIPTYFDVIKEPMDLSTMQKKLNEGIYYTGDEFEADFRLMLRNCYTFNPDGTPVNVLGHKVEEYFNSRWIEKPVPGLHANEDSDMSDVDEEYAETGMVNPAIDVLEEQLRMIRKQLKKLKKDALADFYKRGHRRTLATKRRQPSTSSVRAVPTEMTYEMKRELRDKIDKLPEKKIRTVLAIIQESMPDLGNNGQDEIELEVDALDQQTLLRLYAYAVMGKKEGDQPEEESRKKKARPLSEEEHSRKIAEIENKLKEFDQVAGKSPSSLNAPPPPPELDSSSDEEQMSDSSSEEE